MSARRNYEPASKEHAALFKFLDAYENRTYPDDVGALLGQLSLLREQAALDRPDERAWRKAVSLAVTAH